MTVSDSDIVAYRSAAEEKVYRRELIDSAIKIAHSFISENKLLI